MSQEPRNIELAPGAVLVRATSGGEELQTLPVTPVWPFMLTCTRGGSVAVVLDGRRVTLGPGQTFVAWTTRCEGHAAAFEGASGFLVLLADPRRMGAGLREALVQLGITTGAVSRLVGGGCYRVMKTPAEAARITADIGTCIERERVGQLRMSVMSLVSCLLESGDAVQNADAARVEGPHEELARRAHDLLVRDVSEPMTIASLARELGTSPTVLKEAFKETYGRPVYAWYRRYRMEKASRLLLETQDSVADVALAVGYSNPSKFAKAFGDCMGMTPSAWRSVMRAQGRS